MTSFDFSGLRNKIVELGYNPAGHSSFRIFDNERLNLAEFFDRIELAPDGIFIKDENGKLHKGFLYIENGYNRERAIRNGWKTIVPKFHFADCEVIQKQKGRKNFNGHYVFSTEPVKLEELDGSMQEPLSCKVCMKMTGEFTRVINTSRFQKEYINNPAKNPNFQQEDIPKKFKVADIGYTPDWENLSEEYRIKNKFICENCNVCLNISYADGYYLETHHINRKKNDNDESNLKCLCTLCHANVDETHRRNFSKGRNRSKLEEFAKIYGQRLRDSGNPFIKNYS